MNKTALITGASSGLGKDFATLFAEKGYDLVLTARRKKNLEEISSNLTNQFGIKVFFISCDLSDLKSTEEIYNFCEESKIQIDVLVNNAGYGLTDSFEEISLKDHIDFINVLSTSAIALTRLFLPGMIKRKFGRIVCISSIAGLGKRPNMITYATSKASVIALARNLAEAVAPYIRINTVAPGLIETDMAKAFSKETKKNIIINTPLKRLGTSEDIANTVIYLLSEQSSFITGQTLIVDGGKVVLP